MRKCKKRMALVTSWNLISLSIGLMWICCAMFDFWACMAPFSKWRCHLSGPNTLWLTLVMLLSETQPNCHFKMCHKTSPENSPGNVLLSNKRVQYYKKKSNFYSIDFLGVAQFVVFIFSILFNFLHSNVSENKTISKS